MSLENDIKYYKQDNMSNETIILKYGNRCSGKEYKEQTTMNNDLIKRDLAIAYTSSGLIRRIDGEDWIRTSEVKQSLNDVPTVDIDKELKRQREELYEESKKLFMLAKILGKDERPQGEWIPVSERLPEYSGWYLISLDDIVSAANFTGTYFMSKGGNRIEVDAWQPVPEPYMKGGTQ